MVRPNPPTGRACLTDALRKESHGDQVTKAEVYFATFVAEHNLPFLSADHFIQLSKVMFPDSKTAHDFASGRTTTTAIVKYALAPMLNAEVVKDASHSLFYVMVVTMKWNRSTLQSWSAFGEKSHVNL